MKKKNVPKDVLQAMKMVVIHYLDDEKQHMESLDLSADKHIYGSLKVIDSYINSLSTEEN